ncbi:hypothetical protein D3C87_1719410 [compost metagenome]
MEIDSASTEIEDPGAFVGCLAICRQLQYVDFPWRQLRHWRWFRCVGHRLNHQFMQMITNKQRETEVFIELPRTDRAMASGQAQRAAKTTFLVMDGL